jgi:uncharacterized protein YdhG (YjbR/CyaY superfamily)
MAPPATVEEYLAALPADVQPVVRELRRRIAEALPTSTEKISYAIPTVLLNGQTLISYGAWKSHLGLYPVPVAAGALEDELAPYRSTRDALRFRYRDTVPIELIIRAVLDRAASGRDSAIT